MHSLIHSKTPSFFTLSAFADTQFKQKNTNRSYSLFSLNVKSHNFHLFSINKSQIQHFIQQMQNNNPTPQIKRLQQFTQQFHMAKIYNNNDHSILRHITQIMSLGNPLQSNTTWKSSAIFYPFYVTRVIFDSLFVIKNPLQL